MKTIALILLSIVCIFIAFGCCDCQEVKTVSPTQVITEIDKEAELFWMEYIRRKKLIDSLGNQKDFSGAIQQSAQLMQFTAQGRANFFSEKYTNEYKKQKYWE